MNGAPPVLQGKLARLRTVREDDVPLLTRWLDDREVRYWLHHSDREDASEEEVRARFGPDAVREGELRWTIEDEQAAPVGLIRLEGLDSVHRRAELAITIGEKTHWSRGYGTEAIELALHYGFGELNLRRVWLITDVDNVRGIRCYEKCGFRREGVLRGHRLRYGEPLDMLSMGVLREEWDEPAEGKSRK